MSDKQQSHYKRKIRIEGKGTHAECGYGISVWDLDTGEFVPHVACIVIYLRPGELNEAELTYYETDEKGAILSTGDWLDDDRKPIMGKLRVADPEIDLVAYEKWNAEYIQKRSLL